MMPATRPSAPPTPPPPTTLSTVSNHPPIYKPLNPAAEYISLLDPDDEPQDVKDDGYQEKKSEKARGKEPERERPPRYERKWDRGKPERRTRSRERNKKRKHDTIDFDDGYANKKQRMDAASRKAPWIYNTDWNNCRNVSEM
jgi:non-canonical poly(A) RNA polymerase PAPD5/7